MAALGGCGVRVLVAGGMLVILAGVWPIGGVAMKFGDQTPHKGGAGVVVL